MKNKNPWFNYALDDFKAIAVLMSESVYRLVCFNAQQLSPIINVDMADLDFLSEVYVESRYPPDIGLLPHGEPTKEDAQKALEFAQQVFAQAGKMLEEIE